MRGNILQLIPEPTTLAVYEVYGRILCRRVTGRPPLNEEQFHDFIKQEMQEIGFEDTEFRVTRDDLIAHLVKNNGFIEITPVSFDPEG